VLFHEKVGRVRGKFVFEKGGITIVKINIFNVSNTKKTVLSARFWVFKTLKFYIFKGANPTFFKTKLSSPLPNLQMIF